MIILIIITRLTMKQKHVVIIGGGFGGLYAAKALGNADVKVTLIDRRNFHLFQPLLYQVATGTLSPGDIASPIRTVVGKNKNTEVVLGEVIDIGPEKRQVYLKEGEVIDYDYLLIATGVSHHYFGNEQWREIAPGLKTIEDALDIRRRIFLAFEKAEKEIDPVKQEEWLTFVIVGAGPTGVELAGAIAEIANGTLKQEFRRIEPSKAKILLLEGLDRVLPPYPPELSIKAEEDLKSLGVSVKTKTMVTEINNNRVVIRQGEETSEIYSRTVLWAAGVKASQMGQILGDKTGAQLDRAGRVIVEPDLTIPNHKDIFVIGDLANFPHQGEKPLPGIAPVAMQEGKYVANLIKASLKSQTLPPFRYSDFGNLAVIGRNFAVVNLNFIKLSGFVAWLIWVFAHIWYLIEFDNKLVVMTQWGWNYFTRGRGVRLITGQSDL